MAGGRHMSDVANGNLHSSGLATQAAGSSTGLTVDAGKAPRPGQAPSPTMFATHKIRASGIERLFDSGRRSVAALGPLDLVIDEGEFVCLVGPSGCGKSTFLRIVGGLLNPSRG